MLLHVGMTKGWWLVAVVVFVLLIVSGCATRPVIQTQIVEVPYPVYCSIELPAECKPAYAVDRISVKDDALTINRAMRVEIEERSACEVKLKAALNGCNSITTAQ